MHIIGRVIFLLERGKIVERKKSKIIIIVAVVLVLAIVFGAVSGVVLGAVFMKKEIDYNTVVTDAFSYRFDSESCYHIPKINIDSDAISEINKKMYDDLYPLYEKAEQGYEENGFPAVAFIDYTYGYKDNMLSVVVLTSVYGCFIPEFYIYNIDLKEEELMSDRELYSAFGYSQDDFYDKVREVVQNETDNRLRNMNDMFTESEFTAAIERTLSDSIIYRTVPYINGDGILCVCAYLFEYTTTDMAYHLLNLETEEDEGYFSCNSSHTENEATTAGEVEVSTQSLLSEDETLVQEPLGEESSAGSSENASSDDIYERDKEIYNSFLTDGGYELLTSCRDNYPYTEFNVYSCMADLDYDGVHELLLQVQNTEFLGPRGYDQTYGFFTIKNGKPELLFEAWSSGGSIGGGRLEIVYDTVEKEYAVVRIDFSRDGGFANCGTREIFRPGAGFKNTEEKYFSEYITIPSQYYGDKIEEVKAQTDLYCVSENEFSYYKLNDKFISKDEYENVFGNILVTQDSGDFVLNETSIAIPVR